MLFNFLRYHHIKGDSSFREERKGKKRKTREMR